MIAEIFLDGRKFTYELEYKKVKNINLRIRADGSIYVSASKRVSRKFIENFILSKKDFILNAVEAAKKRSFLPLKAYLSEEELRSVIKEQCKLIYPYYENLGIPFPEIRFRKMVSRWGSCHPIKKILTFNTALMYAPPECVEYVIWHEFTHFIEPNHSKNFYRELSKVCPDWKKLRNTLREINIRGDKNG